MSRPLSLPAKRQFPRSSSSRIPDQALSDAVHELVELLGRESRSSLAWQWSLRGCEDYWRGLHILPLGPLPYWLRHAGTSTSLPRLLHKLQPLRYTAHDFRRLFTTDAVSSGLPVHIVAQLLGHKNLNTTQAYMAIFDEETVRSYRAFLSKRRALRPEAEYREPTEQEWRDFQAHFHARKLELGECGRPYGSTCKHEHSCIRCPSLRLDPRARPRLVEIIANLKDRIQEAKLNGWRGEVTGLEISLREAAQKLVSLDRMRDRQPAGPINLTVYVSAKFGSPLPKIRHLLVKIWEKS